LPSDPARASRHRPDGLGGIFNNREPKFLGDAGERVHVGTLSVEMHGQNRE
jgi:hypothetical protein